MTTPPIDLSSFRPDFTAVIIGASGGIGRALTAALSTHPQCGRTYAFSRSGQVSGFGDNSRVMQARMDVTVPESISAGFDACGDNLDLVICATGTLHGAGLSPEKSWRQMDADAFAQAFAINTTGPALVAQQALGRLNRSHKSAFAALSARVGSISDNHLGGWHAYRASKAALNMLIRNLAIELARKNASALAVGLHPGTVDTPMSEPFQSNVAEAKLFTPQFSAACLLNVLNGLSNNESGGLYAWDGQSIPP
ncbi:MAG: hypothetical protein CME88_05685 [Hirschia sp.]|nr:hypothetical protein [Hirschia sp.]MBF17855.1 hypothetical protein [Hirschia sp.]